MDRDKKVRWMFDPLREEADRRSNSFQIRDQINSVSSAIDIFVFHINESKEALEKITPKTPDEEARLIFEPTYIHENYYEEKLRLQANSIAALHSVRSVFEYFAQLVRMLLIENELTEKECSISRLKNRLPSSPLKNYLQEVLSSYSYKYSSALGNTLKHRSLAKFGSVLKVQTSETGFYFQSFEYNGTRYAEKWAMEVLEILFDVKNAVVRSGALLNEEFE